MTINSFRSVGSGRLLGKMRAVIAESEPLTTEGLLKAIHGDKVRHIFQCPKHGPYSIHLAPGVDPKTHPHVCPICADEESKLSQARQFQRAAMHKAADVVSAFLRDEGVSVPDIRTFDEYVPKTDEQRFAKHVCERFAKGFLKRVYEGKASLGICMIGSYGTGKTHLATAILDVLRKEDVPGIIVRVADLVDALNADPSKVAKRIGALAKVSCLVLDDIGASTLTDSEQKRIYQILDARLQAKLPTIFTTNFDGEDFERAVNGRIVSRIVGNTYKLPIEGPDHRSAAPTMDDLLGDM